MSPEGAHALWRDLAQLHKTYLVEAVEDMDLCPFARRSREQGRVIRPTFALLDEGLHRADRGEQAAVKAAQSLAEVVRSSPDVEIVLLTFIGDRRHPFYTPAHFEAFLRRLRLAYTPASDADRFYMVSFHPEVGLAEHALSSADTLVSRLRCTPDPVIQCVRSEVLERVRVQANAKAHVRMLDELEARFGPMEPGLKETVLATPPQNHLSANIAQRNFERFGPTGRPDELLALLFRLREVRAALEPALVQALKEPLPAEVIPLGEPKRVA